MFSQQNLEKIVELWSKLIEFLQKAGRNNEVKQIFANKNRQLLMIVGAPLLFSKLTSLLLMLIGCSVAHQQVLLATYRYLRHWRGE
jgi:hypothetical protein